MTNWWGLFRTDPAYGSGPTGFAATISTVTWGKITTLIWHGECTRGIIEPSARLATDIQVKKGMQ